jgi:4-alpha-glucanotransferase
VKPVRSSGILLHPTSLPSGKLDREARLFVDWLALAGQSWWQVLPLGPPDDTGSPYASSSAFAGSSQLLARPAARVTRAEASAFRERNASWAEDWIAFAGDGALEDQVRFDREWAALRRYALDRGVRLIGDIPIYVAPGSAEQRAHPELFQAGAVAGVPPDAFTDKGQLWGNPLYDWKALRRHGYAWWTARFRRSFELFDLARIDHFRGFVAYWAVPAGAKYALSGSWKRGPGREVELDAIAHCPPPPLAR